MIHIIFFYFFLLAFWLETVMELKLSSIVGLSLLNLVLYCLLFSWAVIIINKRKLFEPCRANKYIIILFVVIAASIPLKLILNEIPGVDILKELIVLKGWLNPILLFFIIYNALNSKRHLQYALAGLIIFLIVTIISTIGVTSHLFTFGALKIAKARSAGFVEPNQYAAFLVLFVPFFYAKVLTADMTSQRILYATILLFAFTSFLITGSRGGAISIIFATGIFLFLFIRQKIIHAGHAVTMMMIIIPFFLTSSFFIASPAVQKMLANRFNVKEMNAVEMTSGRNLLWRDGFKLFFKKPIFGHGQSSFIPLMEKYSSVQGNSHNDYLSYLVNHGLIGCVLFIMVLWSLFRDALWLAGKSRKKETQKLLLGYIAGFSGYALAMGGVNISQPRYLFWAYSAIILKQGRLELRKTHESN